jgi:hypothetical protein
MGSYDKQVETIYNQLVSCGFQPEEAMRFAGEKVERDRRDASRRLRVAFRVVVVLLVAYLVAYRAASLADGIVLRWVVGVPVFLVMIPTVLKIYLAIARRMRS